MFFLANLIENIILLWLYKVNVFTKINITLLVLVTIIFAFLIKEFKWGE